MKITRTDVSALEIFAVGDEAVVELHGEHDMATEANLRSTLRRLLLAGRGVVVDLTETQFIDSSTAHVLIEADTELRRLGRRLVLQFGTTCQVKRVLEITGVVARLPNATTREQAIELSRQFGASTRPRDVVEDAAHLAGC
jgi:anti-anti-sigma factor